MVAAEGLVIDWAQMRSAHSGESVPGGGGGTRSAGPLAGEVAVPRPHAPA